MLHAAHVETGDLDRLFGGHGHVLVQISIPAQQSVGWWARQQHITKRGGGGSCRLR